MRNKKSSIKIWIYLCMVWIIFLIVLTLAKSVSAVTYTINSSIKINATDIVLNVQGTNYYIANTEFYFEQHTNVTIASDLSYVVNNNTVIIYNNSCTQQPVQNNLSCSFPSKIDLSNESIQYFKEQLSGQIDSKLAEAKNKISDDIQFQLKPSQAYLDELEKSLYSCGKNITEIEKQKYASDLQQEKWYFEYNNCNNENDTWMYISIGMFFLLVVVIAFIANGGFPFRPKVRNL